MHIVDLMQLYSYICRTQLNEQELIRLITQIE